MTRAQTDDAASRSEAALARYRARMRRARLVYFGVVGAIVAALVITAIAVLSDGEAAHAELHTVESAPPALAVENPTATPVRAWGTTDRLAIGTPQAGGTVITYSTHTVSGRDARTGRPTWTYTRSDRTVCTAIQVSNVTVAVYADHGNCDQLDAFDSGTGRRKWTRTLDMDGKPLNGTPTYQVLPYTVMFTSASVIYAVDPSSGINRWNYYRYGCRIDRALLGTAGALISQTCDGRVQCSGVKFCTTGPQLLLRDGSAGTADSGDNRDKIIWLRKDQRSAPVSADGVVSALEPDGRTLSVLRAKDGSTQSRVDIGPGSSSTTALAVDNTELVWRGGTTFAIEAGHASPVWTATTRAPVTALAPAGQALTVANARLTAPVARGVADLDGATGRVNRTVPISVPGGATVYPLGDSFLVGASTGTVAYE